MTTLDATENGPPLRGTRPRHRRQLILAAARSLFYNAGYSHVAMSDIADAVGVGPSALYRHFPGKQELLAEVLLTEVDAFAAALTRADAVSRPLVAICDASLEHRELGVLWARESRHLEVTRRREVRDRMATTIADLRTLTEAHSDFAGWVVVSVLLSPSFHRVNLTGRELPELLGHLIHAGVNAPIPSGAGLAPSPLPRRPRSRREELLNAAINLFAEQGFQAVGIEDIASAASLTGTAIYRHFDSKADLLVAGMTRGAECLRLDLDRALSRATSPKAALRDAVASYVALVLEYPNLISVMLTEASHLPEPDERRIRLAQREYLAEWVQLLTAVHPNESADVARVRAQAAITIVNVCGQNANLRAHADLRGSLQTACEAVLAT